MHRKGKNGQNIFLNSNRMHQNNTTLLFMFHHYYSYCLHIFGLILGQPCTIQCEEITPSSCKGLSYTTTGFPNYFGHPDQNDPTYLAYASTAIPTVLQLGCYDQAQAFLCGLLAPQCVQNSGLIYPSKSTCEAFKSGCGVALLAAGIQLDCTSSIFMDTASPQCNTLPTVPMMPVQSTPEVPNADGPTGPSPSNSSGKCISYF